MTTPNVPPDACAALADQISELADKLEGRAENVRKFAKSYDISEVVQMGNLYEAQALRGVAYDLRKILALNKEK